MSLEENREYQHELARLIFKECYARLTATLYALDRQRTLYFTQISLWGEERRVYSARCEELVVKITSLLEDIDALWKDPNC